MSDKINMSLDEIISNEKRSGNSTAIGIRRRNTRMVGMRKRRNGGPPVSQFPKNAGLNKAATVRLVNKLVQKAIRQRANRSLINRATRTERRSSQQISTRRPVVRGKVGRRFANRSRLAGRLGGVSRLSKVAFKRTNRPQQLRNLAVATRELRGRGIARLGRLVSDAPFEREQGIQEEVVEVVPVLKRGGRHIVVEDVGGGPNRFQNGRNNGIRKRNFGQGPRYVVVNEPFVEKRFIGRAQTGGFNRNFINPNVERMRSALRINRRQAEVLDRQPINSFLQRIPTGRRNNRFYQ